MASARLTLQGIESIFAQTFGNVEPMSVAGNYLVRLLRNVDRLYGAHQEHHAQSIMSRLIARFDRAENVQEELLDLYQVNGMDRFALRLMWSLDRLGTISPHAGPCLLERETQVLYREFLAALHADNDTADDLSETLVVLLSRVSTSVDNLKEHADRNLHRPGSMVDEQKIYGVLQTIEELQSVAAEFHKQEVLQFAFVFRNFLRYILERKMFSDIRVVYILEQANQSLRSVLRESDMKRKSALQETTDLLQHPETLLD